MNSNFTRHFIPLPPSGPCFLQVMRVPYIHLLLEWRSSGGKVPLSLLTE